MILLNFINMKIKKSSLILILLSVTFLLGLASYSPDIPVSELKIKYTNQFSKFIQIDGMDVHYRDEGIGQVIVLLHGCLLYTSDAADE